MESGQNSSSNSIPISGFVWGDQRGSFISKFMKSVLPRASAATPPAPAASASASSTLDIALDSNHPVMVRRRNLVGKSFATYIQQRRKAPKFDDLNAEASCM
jgi:hypothetical protein